MARFVQVWEWVEFRPGKKMIITNRLGQTRQYMVKKNLTLLSKQFISGSLLAMTERPEFYNNIMVGEWSFNSEDALLAAIHKNAQQFMEV